MPIVFLFLLTGSIQVEVKFKDQIAKLPLMIVKEGPTLFGRNWLTNIMLDWKEIHWMKNSSLQEILAKHEEAVFQKGLGTLKGFEVKLVVDRNATPKSCKAITVPYSMKEEVEEELQRLTEEDILEPVEFASWAAPIVPVLKSDKSSVQIWGLQGHRQPC